VSRDEKDGIAILYLGNASPNPAAFRFAAGFQCPSFFK
jgi:hypothetical protein